MAPGTAAITVTFPATPEYLRLARLATADAASRAGLDYEEIDDVRIAVSELCSLVSGAGGHVTLTFDFVLEPGGLTVAGRGDHRARDGGRTSSPDAIIAAVVDEHSLETVDGSTRSRSTKRVTRA